MATLTKDVIFAADDLPRALVEVPEWGGELYVRTMSARERDSWEASIVRMRGSSTEVVLEDARAKLVAMTACDEQGNRLFAEADIPALSAKSSLALERIAQAAKDLNGLGGEDIEELAKN